MRKYYPEMHCSMTIHVAVFSFVAKTKNNANWCAQQSYGIPRTMANLILLAL